METRQPSISATYLGNPSLARDYFAACRLAFERERARVTEEMKNKRIRLAQSVRASRLRAKANGFRAGMREALRNAASQLKSEEQIYQGATSRAQKDCLELVLSIAEEIIAKEVTSKSQSTARRIQRALAGMNERRLASIQLHPEELEETSVFLKAAGVEIPCSPNPELVRGDAILLSASGRIELHWRTHFERIAQRLRSALNATTALCKR